MGPYYLPVKYLLTKVLNVKVLTPNKITNKTVELGVKNSPEFVCMPFKYTLGTFIEALDNHANVLIQAGGGCRYGYYAPLQEKILKDLGYEFTLINLNTGGNYDIKKLYKLVKEIDPRFNLFKFIKYLLITIKMVKYMDKIDDYIRQNIGFEKGKNSFINLQKQMFKSFLKVNSLTKLKITYHKYYKLFKKIPIKEKANALKVGIIGELYTIMEPFANYYLETELAKMNIEVKRFTNVHYLLFEKKRKSKKYLKSAKEYVKYKMGSDASDNIARCKYLCNNNYDGIIHIKSSFCTPEISVMPIINKICSSKNVPIIYFSFDAATSIVGIKTRLEAFYDMLEMRKKK